MNNFSKSLFVFCAFYKVVSCASVPIVNSEHYKVAVGQGECSTTISTISVKETDKLVVAVTADIGSSSLKTDPKYTERYNHANFSSLFSIKVPKEEEDEDEEPVLKRLVQKKSNSSDRDLSQESDGKASGSVITRVVIR